MSPTKLTPEENELRNFDLFRKANDAWDKGDLRKAYAVFRRAALLGDASSQLDLGYFFDQGIGVKRSKKKALQWYRRAYLQGDAGGANNIATIYRDFGDNKKMIWWYKKAAQMGDPDLLLEFGKRYESGSGVRANLAKAKQYYSRAVSSQFSTELNKKEAKARLQKLSRR